MERELMLGEGMVGVNGCVSLVTVKAELVSHHRTLELSLMLMVTYRYLLNVQDRPCVLERSDIYQ